MDIFKKIEHIRQQPEHIRLRFVWGSVAISMFIILAIWIFSLGSLFQGDKNKTKQGNTSIQKDIQTLKQQAPSIKDFTDPQINIKTQSAINTDASEDISYPTDTSDSEVMQTSAYSDLLEKTTAQ